MRVERRRVVSHRDSNTSLRITILENWSEIARAEAAKFDSKLKFNKRHVIDVNLHVEPVLNAIQRQNIQIWLSSASTMGNTHRAKAKHKVMEKEAHSPDSPSITCNSGLIAVLRKNRGSEKEHNDEEGRRIPGLSLSIIKLCSPLAAVLFDK
ncbi:hypothetical protein B0H12DRAFT_1079373 [Mycena haematopus]|nr:hypothetical protein B0H12DRAFT_1079373 [Mycena haematopus]